MPPGVFFTVLNSHLAAGAIIGRLSAHIGSENMDFSRDSGILGDGGFLDSCSISWIGPDAVH